MDIPATATTATTATTGVAPETLAIEGGTPVRQPRINPTGERFGDEELRLLEEVIRFGASSSARALVRPITPCLLAQ